MPSREGQEDDFKLKVDKQVVRLSVQRLILERFNEFYSDFNKKI